MTKTLCTGLSFYLNELIDIHALGYCILLACEFYLERQLIFWY